MKFLDFIKSGMTEQDYKHAIYRYGKKLDTIVKPANCILDLLMVKPYSSSSLVVDLGFYNIYLDNVALKGLNYKPHLKLISDGVDYLLYFQLDNTYILMDSYQNVKKSGTTNFKDFLGENDTFSNLFYNVLEKQK